MILEKLLYSIYLALVICMLLFFIAVKPDLAYPQASGGSTGGTTFNASSASCNTNECDVTANCVSPTNTIINSIRHSSSTTCEQPNSVSDINVCLDGSSCSESTAGSAACVTIICVEE